VNYHLPTYYTVAANIQGAGYQTPTPVQLQTIPIALAGRDLMASAATGSGKSTYLNDQLKKRLLTLAYSCLFCNSYYISCDGTFCRDGKRY
jgi:hypothetical protein